MPIVAGNPGPLLGRAAEIELLALLLDGIGTGGGALVLHGEPGIGKSRLLSVAAELARERGFTVLSTTGVQSEAHLPFAGLHQLLRPLRFHSARPPAAQRAVLDAAFGLSPEPAPERFRDGFPGRGGRGPANAGTARAPAAHADSPGKNGSAGR